MGSQRSAALVAALATALIVPAIGAADSPLPEPVRTLQRAALKDKRAYATLRSLTEQVGHRHAGDPGDTKAVEWAVAMLEAQGFEDVHVEPVTVPHWSRGTASVRVVGDDADLPSISLGGAVGTDGATIEGELVAVTDVTELKTMERKAVEGRIVFLFDQMQTTADGMDYGNTVTIRVQGAIEAAKLGALGVVIRSVGTDDEDLPHTGSLRYADGVPRIPALAIGGRSAERLLARYAAGPVRIALSSSAACMGTSTSANVVGSVRGDGSSDEVVLLGAHLDSWDVGTGAQDDGAGVVTVVEAARRIGEMSDRPRRSLRVVLFANEEFGLSGGHAYALAHEAEMDRIAAAIEADLGSGRVFRLESKVKHADLRAAIRLADLLAPLGIPFRGNTTGGGADTGPLGDRGVPLFELQHDASRYFDIHHTDADRIDRVSVKDLGFNVAAYATLAYALADAPERFTRLPRHWPAPRADVHPCEWRP